MKKKITDNYLERIPRRNESIIWKSNEKGIVTLEIENKGFVNRIFQKLLKKPKISYIHLDEMGSLVWSLTDGVKNVGKIGEGFEEHFGEEAKPVYERLTKYFEILKSYNFIYFINE